MLEHGFILNSYMHKSETSVFSMDEPFRKALDESERLSFTAQLDLFEKDEEGDNTGAKIAELYLYLFDNDKILNEGESLVEVADMLTQDTCNAMETLVKSKLYKKEIDDNAAYMPLFTCYIDRFYVYPEFRKQGIGRYILDNLSDMLNFAFQSPIHCFITYPRPADKNNVTDEVMRKTMLHTFKSAGYTALGKSGFYAKNCVERQVEKRR